MTPNVSQVLVPYIFEGWIHWLVFKWQESIPSCRVFLVSASALQIPESTCLFLLNNG